VTIIFVGFKSSYPAECEVSRFFLHAEHALSDTQRGTQGKMMAFFHFYPVALWRSLNGPFVLRHGKQGRGSQMRNRLTVMKESRAGMSLSEGSCCKTCFPAHPCWQPHACASVCAHILHAHRRGDPHTPPWSCTTTQGPSQQSPALHLPHSGALRCLLDHPNRPLSCEGPG